jgi:hypothetical protein
LLEGATDTDLIFLAVENSQDLRGREREKEREKLVKPLRPAWEMTSLGTSDQLTEGLSVNIGVDQ